MKNDEMEDDEVMLEIREIRARIREETKNMTDEERMARMRASLGHVLKFETTPAVLTFRPAFPSRMVSSGP